MTQKRINRGRIAPSPTGYLHLGHARTFWFAAERVRQQNGTLVLRIEDLDRSRCKSEFLEAIFTDLQWLGLRWDEGPDRGGGFDPYTQSERVAAHLKVLAALHERGFIYPCSCSRQDVMRSLSAPHQGDEEPIYPGTCRHRRDDTALPFAREIHPKNAGTRPPNWRFRVPDGEIVSFQDQRCGLQQFMAGRDFGDFVVWRADQLPSYQLAVVADDAAMQITEVVRGEDLLLSTARQLLIYRALSLDPPEFFHCPLLTDEQGVRLAKRHDSLSLRALRAKGLRAEDIVAGFRLDQGIQ